MSDLIIGRIDNDMVVRKHIAITCNEIITHIEVVSVVELQYRNLKKFLAPIMLTLAINETSDALVGVSDDVNQTIVVVFASAEKRGLLQFLLGRIMVIDVGDLPVLGIMEHR